MNSQDRKHPPVVDQIVTQAGQQIRGIADQIGETAEWAGEGLAHGLDRIEKKYAGVRDAIVDTTKEYSKRTNRVVKDNPWVAMGVTAGFAFVVGVLVGRRR